MDEMAKEFDAIIERDVVKAKHAPVGNGGPKQQPPTVTEVLAVLKARIDADFATFEDALRRLRDSL